ncbi:hypothetical protein BKI52_26120 [marine bacterium AO1-C]|nr:hypothetical protein BKI52_26120 [marine bacterium AO1-C]
MKIGYQEQLVIIVVGILLIFTGLWALSSRKGLYVFGTISIIAIILVVLHFVTKGKEHVVKLLPDEKVLIEEEGVKANIRYFNKSELAPDCKVTLTNLRIVVGKRILFSTQYQDSFYFYFSEKNDELPTPAISLKGTSYMTSLKDIKVKSRKEKSFIYFEPESHLTGMKYIELNVNDASKFAEMLKSQ